MPNHPKILQVSCVQLHWAKSLKENLEKTIDDIHEAKKEGSRVVLFTETNLTSYYFPYAVKLSLKDVENALQKVCRTAKESKIWVIVGSVKKTKDKFLNLAHVISPEGKI